MEENTDIKNISLRLRSNAVSRMRNVGSVIWIGAEGGISKSRCLKKQYGSTIAQVKTTNFLRPYKQASNSYY